MMNSDGSNTTVPGLFWGGGFHLLGIQVIGVLAVIIWVSITMFLVFSVIKHTIGPNIFLLVRLKTQMVKYVKFPLLPGKISWKS